jgi:hypothetical protein
VKYLWQILQKRDLLHSLNQQEEHPMSTALKLDLYPHTLVIDYLQEVCGVSRNLYYYHMGLGRYPRPTHKLSKHKKPMYTMEEIDQILAWWTNHLAQPATT